MLLRAKTNPFYLITKAMVTLPEKFQWSTGCREWNFDNWVFKGWNTVSWGKRLFLFVHCSPGSSLYSFFFSFIFISWRLITLQYCSGFCHTLTWISHGFTCVPPSDPPSRLPPHSIPTLYSWHREMINNLLKVEQMKEWWPLIASMHVYQVASVVSDCFWPCGL